MKNLIRLTDYTTDEIEEIFEIADGINSGKYEDIFAGKTIVMFFPSNSIRTRVTFEKGIHLLGGQAILFPTDTLDKKEDIKDVIGYLNNWADLAIVRYKDINLLDSICNYATFPIINAMTDVNHPCEMLSDLYAFSKIRKNFRGDRFLFCGAKGNIGQAWKEASEVFGFELEQCCGKGYEIEGLKTYNNIDEAIIGKDIVCTDSLPASALEAFKDCQVTKEAMAKANAGAILNPCPPFYRGEEVSDDVIESEYFVGYEFKKCLLQVQQAIAIYCLKEELK